MEQPKNPKPTGESGPERRRAVKALLGVGFTASAATFLYPAVRFAMPPAVAESTATEVIAGAVADFPPNTGRIFKFGNRPGLLVRTEAGDWKAFSAVCTHLDCTVQFEQDSHTILCGCHNGRFDLNGRVISGPPPRPLEEFTVNVRGDEVVVTRDS